MSGVPGQFALFQNYPNPFNPETKIRFQLPAVCHVRLVVFDLLGSELEVLVDEHMQTGSRGALFDASELAGGVYIHRLTAGSFVRARRIIMIR